MLRIEMLFRHLFVRVVIVILVAVGAGCPYVSAQRSIDKLKKEKQATRREIRETTRKIKDNKAETNRQLGRLTQLRGDIERQNAIIADARTKADSVSSAMAVLGDSIALLETRLGQMKSAFGKSLRKMQGHAVPTTKWAFIFSSENVEMFYRRIRYMEQFAEWNARQSRRIRRAMDGLQTRRDHMALLARERDEFLQRADLAGRQLKNKHQETSQLVASLQQQGSSLKETLKAKEQRQRKLDSEIDRLIAAEQERQRRAAEKKRSDAEKQKKNSGGKNKGVSTGANQSSTRTADPDRVLTGSFESNKGHLLFPVAGKYRIVKDFGRQPHPDLPHVVTQNSGIDIDVAPGTSVRSIFAGKVSAIFRQDGFNSIVMVRHGAYISIYAGLGSLSVKSGDSVKAGQTLGSVAADDDGSGRSTLHFELRREREKLNPHHWVR